MFSMKKIIFIAYTFLFSIAVFSQPTLVVNGGKSYKYEPDVTKTGLNLGCYVVQADVPLSLNFTSDSSEPIKLYSFGEYGSSQKEYIPVAIQQGKSLTYTGGKNDCGYVIEQGSSVYSFWVSSHRTVTSLESDYSYSNMCENARIYGEGITIPYHSTRGQIFSIPRKVKFYTWEWNEDEQQPETSVEKELLVIPSVDDKMVFDSPYEKTIITIVDNIPTIWNGKAIETSTDEEFVPQAIFMEAVVTQSEREATNEIEVDNEAGSYGGSAPIDMVFEAYVNEDNYFCWQFFKSAIGPDDESPIIYATYLDQTLEYTFKDAGTTYVRLHSENATCSKDITFTINVSESYIDAPNVFSPGVSPGVNDEWKVAYKSIVEFKCAIFDRWGVKMFEFNDPSIGWNGKYGGKYVPSGVYFYVIQARGSDGQDYKLKGHINILRGKDTYDE